MEAHDSWKRYDRDGFSSGLASVCFALVWRCFTRDGKDWNSSVRTQLIS